MILSSHPDMLNSISELIKLSVTPVFLLAAVAGLLNVFAGRLARIIDRVDKVEKMDKSNMTKDEIVQKQNFLSMRIENINLAILFCTLTGLLVAMVIVMIFAGGIFDFNSETIVSILFILSMLCLVMSLIVFLKEIYYTTAVIRAKKIHNS
jgi:CBS domain containing-hemolysin-like protein